MNIKSKIAVCSSAAALALLGAFSASHIGQKPAPQPTVRPVSAFTQEDGAFPPPAPHPTSVGEETTNVESDSATRIEIDFEPLEPRGGTAFSTPKEPLRDKPTPSTTASQTPSHHAPIEPQMGITRTVDGQKKVYVLGFGWIDDNDEPNVGIFVDGDGDINKMVGMMD